MRDHDDQLPAYGAQMPLQPQSVTPGSVSSGLHESNLDANLHLVDEPSLTVRGHCSGSISGQVSTPMNLHSWRISVGLVICIQWNWNVTLLSCNEQSGIRTAFVWARRLLELAPLAKQPLLLTWSVTSSVSGTAAGCKRSGTWSHK